ncbi:MAG: methyl-accepting chemotaxis protein, partial [Desulfobacterales bacterium]|nr:methyl-accepting chemotaxis protein [Desulfobacterales bacterium]
MLRSFGLGKKIGLGFFIMLALLAGVAGVGRIGLQNVVHELGCLTRFQTLANSVWEVRLTQKDFMVTQSPTVAAQVRKQINRLQKRAGGLKNEVSHPETQTQVARIINALAKYESSFENYSKSVLKSGDKARGAAAVEASASEVNTLIWDIKKEVKSRLQHRIESANSTILITAVVALIFGIFITLGLVRLITRPLRRVVDVLKDIAEGEGDLTRRIDLKSRDEIGELARWFDAFISRLNNIIVDIGANSETVTASSGELLVVAEQMEDDSSELAGRSNSVATAAEEMSASMSTVADASEQATSNHGSVTDAANQMKHTIQEVADNCDNARKIAFSAVEKVKTASVRVGRLGSSAQDIDKVTQAITDIAEQTNLLALNATIEAARAGEAGKGFAVVATEVKELAKQTADATDDIRTRIEAIQSSTGETVDAIGEIE